MNLGNTEKMELYAHAMDVLGHREWPLLKGKIGEPQVAAACKAYVDAVLKLRQADEDIDHDYFAPGTELERIVKQTKLLNESTLAHRNKDRTHRSLMVELLGEENVYWVLDDDEDEDDWGPSYEDQMVAAMY